VNSLSLASIIWEKSRLNLKSEASANYLSYAWWFFEPVIQMACYYLVFDFLLKRGGPGYVYFLLVGLVPWLWFARTVNQGANSLVGGRGLMNQLNIPKLFFPSVFITQCAVKQLLVFSVLLVFLFFSGKLVTVHWLAAPVLITVQFIMMIPITFLLAYGTAFLPDLKFVIPTFIQFMFFCSGIFFSINSIPEAYRDYFLLNPIAGLINSYRVVLLENQWPDWTYLLSLAVISLFMSILVLSLYKTHDQKIARVVQE
jgi:lipopolysaccharide transport system permease protein